MMKLENHDANPVTAAIDGATVGEIRSVLMNHDYVLVRTTQHGVHSGRPRFMVACSTCMVLLHEATTGPQLRIGEHEYDIERERNAAQTVEVPAEPADVDRLEAIGQANRQRIRALWPAPLALLVAAAVIALALAERL